MRRYFAYRLESFIDEEEFADLVRESANRIKGRQETDTIELLDEYEPSLFRASADFVAHDLLQHPILSIRALPPALRRCWSGRYDGRGAHPYRG